MADTKTDNCFNIIEFIKNAKKNAIYYSKQISKGLSAIKNYAVCAYQIATYPAKIADNVASTINSYTNQILDIKKTVKGAFVGKNNILNRYANAKLNLTSAVSSFGNAIVNIAKSGEFKSRSEVMNAIDSLESALDDYKEFVDEMNTTVSTSSTSLESSKQIYIDSSETYYKVEKYISNVISYVLQVSFSLPTRRTIVLGTDRQILELLTELYGDVERFDEFVSDNHLNADEIEIIPMGREISYYVS